MPVLQRPLQPQTKRERQSSFGHSHQPVQQQQVRTSAVPDASSSIASPLVAGESEFIAIWHDGSRNKDGIAGAATVSLTAQTREGFANLSAVQQFYPGRFTPACAQYFGMLIGLQELLRHPEWISGRRVVAMGDCDPIVRPFTHGQGLSAESQYLVILVDEACRMRSALERGSNASIEFRRVHRKSVHVEDKVASATLHAKTTVFSVSELATAVDRTTEMWQPRVDSAPTAKQFQDLLANNEIISQSGEGRSQPSGLQPQTLSSHQLQLPGSSSIPPACREMERAKLTARLAMEGFGLADMPNEIHNGTEATDMLKELGYASALERARVLKALRQWREASEGVEALLPFEAVD